MNAVQTQNEFHPFIYGQQVRLKEACWINNEPHFTRRAIGEWLEYRNPQKKIDGIIAKNPQIDQFSTVVKLTTVDEYPKRHSTPKLGAECPAESTDSAPSLSGTVRCREIETRIYNPIGLQLIVFESHQPKAKVYKIAVAHLVQAFMRGEVRPPKRPSDVAMQFKCEEVLQLSCPQDRTDGVMGIAEHYGKHRATVYRWIQTIKRKENPADKRYGHRKGKRAYMTQNIVDAIQVLVRGNPDITAREIILRVPGVDCSAIGTIYKIKRKIMAEEFVNGN